MWLPPSRRAPRGHRPRAVLMASPLRPVPRHSRGCRGRRTPAPRSGSCSRGTFADGVRHVLGALEWFHARLELFDNAAPGRERKWRMASLRTRRARAHSTPARGRSPMDGWPRVDVGVDESSTSKNGAASVRRKADFDRGARVNVPGPFSPCAQTQGLLEKFATFFRGPAAGVILNTPACMNHSQAQVHAGTPSARWPREHDPDLGAGVRRPRHAA